MRYCGAVTDPSYYSALARLDWPQRREIINRDFSDPKYEEGLKFIYSCGRMPRVYSDEINSH
jgi:hypothetical protein